LCGRDRGATMVVGTGKWTADESRRAERYLSYGLPTNGVREMIGRVCATPAAAAVGQLIKRPRPSGPSSLRAAINPVFGLSSAYAFSLRKKKFSFRFYDSPRTKVSIFNWIHLRLFSSFFFFFNFVLSANSLQLFCYRQISIRISARRITFACNHNVFNTSNSLRSDRNRPCDVPSEYTRIRRHSRPVPTRRSGSVRISVYSGRHLDVLLMASHLYVYMIIFYQRLK